MRSAWPSSSTGGGPTTSAGSPSPAAWPRAASSARTPSSAGTRSRPTSIVASLAPNEKTTRLSAPGAIRGRASTAHLATTATDGSRRTPRL